MVKTGAKGLDKKNESYISFRDFISEGENVPNNPKLWKKAIAKAKAKFDVYPSSIKMVPTELRKMRLVQALTMFARSYGMYVLLQR